MLKVTTGPRASCRQWGIKMVQIRCYEGLAYLLPHPTESSLQILTLNPCAVTDHDQAACTIVVPRVATAKVVEGTRVAAWLQPDVPTGRSGDDLIIHLHGEVVTSRAASSEPSCMEHLFSAHGLMCRLREEPLVEHLPPLAEAGPMHLLVRRAIDP